MSNQNIKKPNHLKDLILLFAIPIGITIFAVIAVYVPQLFANPKSDFIYSICNNYSCRHSFNVDSSGYVSQYNRSRDYPYDTSILRYYSAKDDSTKILTLEEAKRYRLNTSSKSPDGYSLAREDGDSGFLFWGKYKPSWYLKNGVKKNRVELSTDDSYYSQDVKFLGWTNK